MKFVEVARRLTLMNHAGIWCNECGKVTPLQIDPLLSFRDPEVHDATDLVCGTCKFIIATLHQPRVLNEVR